jgi:hypothetical protein
LQLRLAASVFELFGTTTVEFLKLPTARILFGLAASLELLLESYLLVRVV